MGSMIVAAPELAVKGVATLRRPPYMGSDGAVLLCEFACVRSVFQSPSELAVCAAKAKIVNGTPPVGVGPL